MSRLTYETVSKIKEQILKCIDAEPKTTRAIAREINRSWNLTSKLLAELEMENPRISCIKIGSIKAYGIAESVPPLQKTT